MLAIRVPHHQFVMLSKLVGKQAILIFLAAGSDRPALAWRASSDYLSNPHQLNRASHLPYRDQTHLSSVESEMNAFPVVSFNYVPAALEPDELGATQAHAHVPNIALPTRPHGRLDELVSRRAPHSPEAQFGGTPPQSWTATALRLPGPEQMVEGKEPPAEWPLIGIPTPGERPLPPLVNPSTAYTSADVERCESATPRRPQLPANCFKLNSQPHGKEIPPRADGIKTPKGKHFLPEIKNQVKELHREGKSAKEITQSIPGLRATQVASILQNWRDPQASTRCMKRKAEELSGNSGAKYTEYKKLQKANRSPGVRIVVVSFDS